MFEYILLYLLLVNITTFFVFGLDKYKAKRDQWRIPEATLFSFCFIGGSAGALAGMYLFHHKTKKIKFKLGVPAILLAHIGLAAYLFWF